MELQEIVETLCEQVPDAIGAVVCDFEGETVVSALGKGEVPEEASQRASEHVPRGDDLGRPIQEWLVRIAAAEPCALLRLFSEQSDRHGLGDLDELEMRYRQIDLLVKKLPSEFYLVLLLRRPSISALARRNLRVAGEQLLPHLV